MVTEEDIKKYLDKSGDSFIYEDNIVVNEHGFMSWNIKENKLVLLNVYVTVNTGMISVLHLPRN